MSTAGFHHPFQESNFTLFTWYPKYQACQRFFLEHAQHTAPIQSVAAFVNILLPFQKDDSNLASSSSSSSAPPSTVDYDHLSGPTFPSSRAAGKAPVRASNPTVSLVPYIRRLVATGFDIAPIMHGFFGDDWREGVGEMHEVERRNFLFAAKSETWLNVKRHYDMPDGQLVPFLSPLQRVVEKEIQGAEQEWSKWLAMQDWMLGPRAPPDESGSGVRIKMEED